MFFIGKTLIQIRFSITERCNSFCIMCSQPPRDIDDHYLLDDMLEALPLIPKDALEIGITGGEPTLWGNDFIRLVQALSRHIFQELPYISFPMGAILRVWNWRQR